MQTNIIKTFTETLPDRSQEQCCNARDLHAFLEVATRFNDWIKDRIERYEFVEGEDYLILKSQEQASQLDYSNSSNQDAPTWGGDRRSIDYHLTLDMAKELAMIENNPKGREARRYFIRMEKFARMLTQHIPKEQVDRRKQALTIFVEMRNHLLDNHNTDLTLAIELAAAEVTSLTGVDLLKDQGIKIGTNRQIASEKAADLISADPEMGKFLNHDERHTLEMEMARIAAVTGQAISQVYDWLSERLDIVTEARIPRYRFTEAINLLRLRQEYEERAA